MATIFDVASYFIAQSNAETEPSMTPLKLQKLCYYAQAWSLVWDGNPLFEEDFEAWAHGPVNPSLYQKYRSYQYCLINEEVDEAVFHQFTPVQQETMNIIWDDYGKYDGKYLEALTHTEKPWIEARGERGAIDFCNTIISKKSLKQYYGSL